MRTIPTAEEFNNDIRYVTYSLDEKLITFAKLHVQEALKEASEKAEMNLVGETDAGSEYDGVDKESILNAYPLTNIK